MAKKQLHPSVQQFKEFVRANPELIKTVRSGKNTWQELFEEWYLLGEDNARWSTFNEEQKNAEHPKQKEEHEKKDWMSHVMGTVKNMDPNQLQGYIANISSALGAIQGVIASLQGGGHAQEPPKNNVSPPSHPFKFRQD